MPTDPQYLESLWAKTVERFNRMIIDGGDFDETKATLAAERHLIDPYSKKRFLKRVNTYRERDLWLYTRLVLNRNRANLALAKMGKRQNAWNRFFYADVHPPG